MSQTESLAAPKASFDRRSVVKTAAWSVPVITAAIAAPAAAASAGTQTLTFAAPALRPEVAPRKVSAPESFTIKNTGATIAGPLLFSIIITPTPSGGAMAKKMAQIGVKSVESTNVNGSFNKDNVFTGTVTVSGGLPAIRNFALTYSYGSRGANDTDFGSYSVQVSLTSPSLTPSLSGFTSLTDTK